MLFCLIRHKLGKFELGYVEENRMIISRVKAVDSVLVLVHGPVESFRQGTYVAIIYLVLIVLLEVLVKILDANLIQVKI